LGQSLRLLPYQELKDPDVTPTQSWSALQEQTSISFVSTNERFAKSQVPGLIKNTLAVNLQAWRGEKVHAQFLIRTKRSLGDVSFKIKETDRRKSIHSRKIEVSFVRYVMTDGLSGEGGGCGIRHGHDSSLVADVIDPSVSLDVKAFTVQPVWVSISISRELPAGNYENILVVNEGGKVLQELKISIEVLNQTLPPPSQWKYHLDLWQNPYAVAREHHVKSWSKGHMNVMRPYMKRLADAGQKAITVSIIHDPWNGQTHDIYHAMIRWEKKKDGTWYYDYSVFDQWVSFMMSVGINKVINCYSMIPWNLKFYYFDEASGKELFIQARPGTLEYDAHWRSMLADFAKHLKIKGWFDKVSIAMDERALEDMQKAIAVIRSVDPDFKISLAGNFHPEIERDLYDYSVASNQVLDAQTLTARQNDGKVTSYYTCCTEGFPNTFTFSSPAESAWLAWFSSHKKYDGYLRWAYNCWSSSALLDSRYGSWSAGDAFLVYPGNRTSIRFERMIEGIQDVEKINILKEKFILENKKDKLASLNSLLDVFEINALKTTPASEMIDHARQLLYSLSQD
jgi:hypothetical protein